MKLHQRKQSYNKVLSSYSCGIHLYIYIYVYVFNFIFLKPIGSFNSGERYAVVFNMNLVFKYKNQASGEFIHCAFYDHGAFLKTLNLKSLNYN